MHPTFFIRKLKPAEATIQSRIEVQLLDSSGRAVNWVVLQQDTDAATIEGVRIPESVIETAKSLQSGEGIYCDSAGLKVDPF